MGILLVVLIPLALMLGGIWITWQTSRQIVRGIAAGNWPTASGVITQVDSKEYQGGRGPAREVIVRYAYEASGRRLEGSVIHPAYGASNNEAQHRDLERCLQPGVRVAVHYDPASPENATLSVGFVSSTLVEITGGLVITMMGFGFGLIFWLISAGKRFADGITLLP